MVSIIFNRMLALQLCRCYSHPFKMVYCVYLIKKSIRTSWGLTCLLQFLF